MLRVEASEFAHASTFSHDIFPRWSSISEILQRYRRDIKPVIQIAALAVVCVIANLNIGVSHSTRS